MRYTVEVNENGTYWYKEGTTILHRQNGPAIEYSDGSKEWRLNGMWHRENGPAIERSNGDKQWRLNGIWHRENGPAIEHSNGKEWWINGQLHREDGPAVERSNGNKYWYLNGKILTEEEFNAKTKASCNGKIVEINGKKFKLVEV